MDNIAQTTPQARPREFFSASPFRSPRFVFVFALLTILVISDIVVIAKYEDRLSFGDLIWLAGVLTWLGAVSSVLRAFRHHARIRELFLVGRINEPAQDGPLQLALEVAKDTMLDGLFYTLAMALTNVWFFVHCIVGKHGTG